MAEPITTISTNPTEHIWSLNIPSKEKYVLLALVGLVPFDGTQAEAPTLEVAARTGYQPQTVRGLFRTLQRSGIVSLTRQRNRLSYLPSLISINLNAQTVRRAEYVYVFEAQGLFKIGRSLNPRIRLQAINATLKPHNVEAQLVHTIECENSVRLEKLLHRHFRFRRREGEWFALTTEDVEFLKAQDIVVKE